MLLCWSNQNLRMVFWTTFFKIIRFHQVNFLTKKRYPVLFSFVHTRVYNIMDEDWKHLVLNINLFSFFVKWIIKQIYIEFFILRRVTKALVFKLSFASWQTLALVIIHIRLNIELNLWSQFEAELGTSASLFLLFCQRDQLTKKTKTIERNWHWYRIRLPIGLKDGDEVVVPGFI